MGMIFPSLGKLHPKYIISRTVISVGFDENRVARADCLRVLACHQFVGFQKPANHGGLHRPQLLCAELVPLLDIPPKVVRSANLDRCMATVLTGYMIVHPSANADLLSNAHQAVFVTPGAPERNTTVVAER